MRSETIEVMEGRFVTNGELSLSTSPFFSANSRDRTRLRKRLCAVVTGFKTPLRVWSSVEVNTVSNTFQP